MRECTHLPCLWPHRCPRHRDHFVTSSTPFLARSGLEALATVRVEEDTGAVPRSATGSVAFGRNGLSSSNGRLVRNRPFAHSDRFPGHKGAGKAGCRLAPAISCAMCTDKCAHEHTGTAGAARHSLRSGFTAYSALSPETNSFCLRHRRIEDLAKPGWDRNISAGLTPATGARTTRLCRPLQRCSPARGLR